MQDVFDPARLRRNLTGVKMDDDLFLVLYAAQILNDRFKDISYKFDNIDFIGGRGADFLDMTPGQIWAEPERFESPDRDKDCIIALLSQHHINDLPGHLRRVRQALKPDGMFIGVMFGGETLYELRAAFTAVEMSRYGGVRPHIHPFADKPQIGALMQNAGFALPVIDSEIVKVSYDSLFKLMRDLKSMGEGYALLEKPRIYPKSFFEAVQAQCHLDHPDPQAEGRFLVSFEMIFMLGWAPHESQQKPLRRGSADKSLTEVL